MERKPQEPLSSFIHSFIHVLRVVENTKMKDLIPAVKDFVHQECKMSTNSYHTRRKAKIHKGGTKKVCSKTEEISYLESY